MTKLLLNTATVPLYTEAGSPVPPGGIATDDEFGDVAQILMDDGVLVHVRPSEVPEDNQGHLTEAAVAHITPSGNAEPGSGDDAPVTPTTPKAKGGQS